MTPSTVIQCTSNGRRPCLTLTDLHEDRKGLAWPRTCEIHALSRLAGGNATAFPCIPSGFFLEIGINLSSFGLVLRLPRENRGAGKGSKCACVRACLRVFKKRQGEGEDERRRRGGSKSVCEEARFRGACSLGFSPCRRKGASDP